MIIMNQKLRYVRLVTILIIAIALVSNFGEAASLQKGQGANRHSTALYDPNLVCGDHLCGPHDKVVIPEPKK